jgi:hypothetical protein
MMPIAIRACAPRYRPCSDTLKFPRYRALAGNEFKRVTWDFALDRIATLMKQDRDANFIVGCGYHALSSPVDRQGGLQQDQNAFGQDPAPGQNDTVATVLSHLAPSRRWWQLGISIPRIAAERGSIAMDCVECGSAAVAERPDRTAQS